MPVWWIVGSHPLLGLGDALLEASGISATPGLAVMAAAPWPRRTTHQVH
ncbi:hypothetical protein [Streptomyces ferrugineus]|nr:hypothetical protein [Streptomyces ferrugineus]